MPAPTLATQLISLVTWRRYCPIVCGDLKKIIKVRFDREGISIPYPQRDIHVISGEVA